MASNAQIEVFTLRPFAVHVNGVPLAFPVKSPHKPLELLKVLIALGGEGVPEQMLSDALWPESDGDATHHNFASTLYRLRRLTHGDAMRLRDRRLSVIPDLCWVDAFAFTAKLVAIDRARLHGDAEALAALLDEMLELYRAPFLDGEFSPAEILSARERLHSQFLHHVSESTRRLAGLGRPAQAGHLLRRALDADGLSEELHQQLIRCEIALGHFSEAHSAYERCRRLLREAAGIEPSPETNALHHEVVEAARASAFVSPSVPTHSAGQPLLALPSIAVLPFVNFSGDPEQEYLADGLTEDIITGLCRFKELFVIARSSAFRYKGTAPDLREAGRELGVRYILEGSVRKSGDRVRITAQLVDCTTNAHIWAGAFDREFKDVFAVQDAITSAIVGGLPARIERQSLERARRKPPVELQAYDLDLQARRYIRSLSREEHGPARDQLERAVDLDPNFAPALSDLSWVYLDECRYGYNARPRPLDRALDAAWRAVTLDPDDAYARWLLAKIHFFRKELTLFETAAKAALTMNPNDGDIVADVATHLSWIGRLDEAYNMANQAIRLNPLGPSWYRYPIAAYHYLNGRHEQALSEILQMNMPKFAYYHAWVAMIYGRMGRIEEAKTAAAEALKLKPDLEFERHYQDYNFAPTILEEFLKGVRVAGLK